VNANQHSLATEWFERLTQLDASARDGALAKLRTSDPELARLLEELLRADDSGSRLDRPAFELLVKTPLSPLGPGADPTTIGRYRILGRLGGGGMGVVYEAEQDQPRRRVALKVLRRALLDARALQRFEDEAEVLGWLTHPNIARIYEAGSALLEGEIQPFFAMELVRGAPLDEHAERAKLALRERVELVASLCDAIEHAHRRGVVHRDLKPSNVLVDEAGCPKVLDFGVARVAHRQRGAALNTQVGELVGTPAYMSPEQLRGDPLAIDARTDVYALGVLAFELFARRKLHDVARLPIHEAICAVLDTEAPLLGAVDRALRGDLETIVAKALEKDRERRYGSAQELAADLRRFLADDPIAARPPSTVYQLGKFARRHRALVASTATVFLALAAGLAISWRMYSVAEAARADEREARLAAEESADELRETTSYFLELLQSPMPEYGGVDTRVLDVLERARPRIDRAFVGRPAQRARLLATLARVHHGVGDYESAWEFAREALELTEAATPVDRGARVDALQGVATSAAQLGRLDDALAAIEQAVAELADSDPTLRRATVHGTHARVLLALQRVDEAQAAAQRTSDALAADPSVSASVAAPEQLTLAQVLRGAGRLDEAREVCLASIAAQQAESDEITYALVCFFDELAAVEHDAKRYPESAEWLRKSLDRLRELVDDGHPTIATHLSNLAAVLRLQGKLDEAAPLLEEALELARASLPAGDPGLALKIANHALLVSAKGDPERAESLLRESYAMLDPTTPQGELRRAYVQYQLGQLLSGRGRHDEACAELEAALETHVELLGPERPEVRSVASALGRAQLEAGRGAQAAETIEGVLRTLEDSGADRDGTWLDLVLALSSAQLDSGDGARALDTARRAWSVLERLDDAPLAARGRAALGLALVSLGRRDEAEPHLAGCEREHVEHFGDDHALTRQLRARLARDYLPPD
jgi:tetratricopeptide (TPR) repeat protein/predicted Ser/Thr protein kinase